MTNNDPAAVRPRRASKAVKGGDSGDRIEPVQSRLKTLEEAMVEMRATLARIDEKLNRVATKDDATTLENSASKLERQLNGTLSFWQFVVIVCILLAIPILIEWGDLFGLSRLMR